MRDMVEFLRYKYTVKDMFSYMDERLKCQMKGDAPFFCIRDYVKIKKGFGKH